MQKEHRLRFLLPSSPRLLRHHRTVTARDWLAYLLSIDQNLSLPTQRTKTLALDALNATHHVHSSISVVRR
jgi:hypothetical protein